MNNLVELAPQIKAAISAAKSILLHCHPSPDPDSYGSALGLYHYLIGLGKRVTVIKGDSPVPDFAQFLPGSEAVVSKNYLEIDPEACDLFIILDAGSRDRVSTLGPVVFPSTMRTILIDHHATTEPFTDLAWVDPAYAATAEMLHDLVTSWGETIPAAAAACWLVGLYTDSGGFKYPNTRANTFRAAAHLAELAPDYHQIIFALENNNQPNAIKFQGLALSQVSIHFSRVAISALSYEQIRAAGLTENDTKSITVANILKSVKGWDIGIHLFEWEPGKTKLSARTRDASRFDLTKFAGLLGGGGHRAAAGAHLNASLAEAQTKVLAALQTAYPELVDNH